MAKALSKLEVRLAEGTDIRGEPRFEIWIDGTRLLDAVSRAEVASIARGARKNAIGAYRSLPWLDYGTLLCAGEHNVLGCDGCGFPDCWPLRVTVAISDGLVTWSGFNNPFMRDWDYRDLGPFRFDEATYRETWLAALDFGEN
jgi:hypothetical protein